VPFTPGARRPPSAGATSRTRTWDGLGTCRGPFSAHRYKDIGERLSQATLAQRDARKKAEVAEDLELALEVPEE
jgi:hypothetical protein